MDPLFAAYVAVTAVLVLTPGSTTAVVMRQSLVGGRAAGLAAALGAATGNTSHAVAAGFGLAVVFSRWPAAIVALRISGAVYLSWLGFRTLHRVLLHPDGGLRLDLGPAATHDAPARLRWSSFREGLAVNLLNPAIATFYLVVVPTFVPAAAPMWYFALLAIVHVAMAFVCHGVWAFALEGVRSWPTSPTARRTLEAATGCALVLLAVRVLLG